MHRSRRIAVAAVLSLAFPASTALAVDWPQFRLDWTHQGVTSDNGPSAFNVRWEHTTSADVRGQAAVVGGFVYFVGYDGTCTA